MKSAPKAIASSQGKVTGSQQRSQIRIKKILESAQHILITEGFQNLSLRKIAQHMGISNGNVTYYFPNKKVLLRAIIEDVLSRYEAEFEEEAVKFPDAPEKRIAAYISHLIKDAWQPESRSFFYQLWALSTHNPIAAELRDEVYSAFLSQLFIQIQAVRPELDEQSIRDKSLVLMSLLEGLNVMLGSSDRFLSQFKDIDDYVHQQVMMIILN